MRITGVDVCECDACGEKRTVAPGSPDSANWHDRKRYTAAGAEQPFLLCDECNEAYRDLLITQDKMHEAWLNERKGQ